MQETKQNLNFEIINAVMDEERFFGSEIIPYYDSNYSVPKQARSITNKRIIFSSVMLLLVFMGTLLWNYYISTISFSYLLFFAVLDGSKLFANKIFPMSLTEIELLKTEDKAIAEEDLDIQWKKVYGKNRNYIYYQRDYYKVPERVKVQRDKEHYLYILLLMIVFVVLNFLNHDFALQLTVICILIIVFITTYLLHRQTFVKRQIPPGELEKFT